MLHFASLCLSVKIHIDLHTSRGAGEGGGGPYPPHPLTRPVKKIIQEILHVSCSPPLGILDPLLHTNIQNNVVFVSANRFSGGSVDVNRRLKLFLKQTVLQVNGRLMLTWADWPVFRTRVKVRDVHPLALGVPEPRCNHMCFTNETHRTKYQSSKNVSNWVW